MIRSRWPAITVGGVIGCSKKAARISPVDLVKGVVAGLLHAAVQLGGSSCEPILGARGSGRSAIVVITIGA